MTRPLGDETLPVRNALIALGQRYDRFGWVLGTGGNLSGRTPSGFVVTASGRHKGMLKTDDFVELDLAGRLVAGDADARPSAEAALHAAVYNAHPAANVALHVHTPVAATTDAQPDTTPLGKELGHLVFADLEMVKAWGFAGYQTEARMPVFENHADVGAIARELVAWFAASQRAAPPPYRWAPAVLIRSHGVTAWGEDAFSANRNLETAEFLMQAAARRAQIGR